MLLFTIFLFGSSLLSAENIIQQLQTLEKAVNQCIDRLDSDISLECIGGLTDTSGDDNFMTVAGRQLELSLLSMNAGHLLQEDYYHFSLYLIARHYKKYEAALELLRFEKKMAGFIPLQNWLQKLIDTVTNLQRTREAEDHEFAVARDFQGLIALLKKYHIR